MASIRAWVRVHVEAKGGHVERQQTLNIAVEDGRSGLSIELTPAEWRRFHAELGALLAEIPDEGEGDDHR